MSNQRDIAASLGLTLATVSRALRNSPLVTSATRKRVHAAAKKLGYVPNPLVATLMEHVRSGRKLTDQGTLGVLTASPGKNAWLQSEVFSTYYRGLEEQALRRGYRTECLFLRQPGMTVAAANRILNARDIRAIIVADPSWPAAFRGFPWHHYAVCRSAWWRRPSPMLDTVVSDHFHNLGMAFTRLQHQGCTRIGLCLHKITSSRWIGAYLFHQSTLPQRRQLPIFQGPSDSCGPEAFLNWYKKWRPDGILSGGIEGWRWMQEIGVTTEQTAFASLNRPHDSPFGGIDENSPLIGAAACDMAINNLMHNELGVPKHAREILIKGGWLDAPLAPRQM